MPQPEGKELEDIRARREELRQRYLRPESERPHSTVRGVHHLALICRDCSDKYYIVFGNDAGASLTGAAGGTNVLIARPRQVLLQLTVHPNLF